MSKEHYSVNNNRLLTPLKNYDDNCERVCGIQTIIINLQIEFVFPISAF